MCIVNKYISYRPIRILVSPVLSDFNIPRLIIIRLLLALFELQSSLDKYHRSTQTLLSSTGYTLGTHHRTHPRVYRENHFNVFFLNVGIF